MAGVLVIAGIVTADFLSTGEDSETITARVLQTVGARRQSVDPRSTNRSSDATAATAPLTPRSPTVTDAITMFETVIHPRTSKVTTVVVRKPGEKVSYPVTVPGPVREHVVTRASTDTVVQTQTQTNDRFVTVSTPAETETVSRTVTDARTVTDTRTVTQPSPTVTETNVVTVKAPVTVVTVTTPVIVTVPTVVTVTVPTPH
jgi:hypothetical protein